jgi:hypothetical protein
MREKVTLEELLSSFLFWSFIILGTTTLASPTAYIQSDRSETSAVSMEGDNVGSMRKEFRADCELIFDSQLQKAGREEGVYLFHVHCIAIQ